MMFLGPEDDSGDLLAISQPAHAWVSGQLLRQWAAPLNAALLLAAEQHDLAWLDWERAPSFDPATGRPHLFRDVGAAEHAPRWAEAVERAYAAWGSRVALLVSRHGTVIYTRFSDRHRTSGADATAAARYIEQQAPIQHGWARQLGLDAVTLARDSDLIALVDTLSLGLCGGLALPLEVEGPAVSGGTSVYRLARLRQPAFHFTLTPWPFRDAEFCIDIEARALPGGRFPHESDMRRWLHEVAAAPLRFTLTRVG